MNTWLPEIALHPLGQRVGWAILHSLWQGAAAALVLAVVLRLLRNGSPQARWFASCVALTCLAAAPIVTASLVTIDSAAIVVADPTGSPNAAPAEIRITEPAPPSGDEIPRVAVVATENVGAVNEPASTSTPPPTIAVPPTFRLSEKLQPLLPWIVLAWLTGVAALSIWQVGGWLLIEWTKRRLAQAPAAEIADLFERLRQRLQFSRPVRLLETAAVATPMVVGAIWPVILLPLGIVGGLTPSQLEAVLAHELAHIRRHDYLVGLIQSLLETLMFYHPAVWWISGRVRQECEVCCDEWTLAACPDRRDYATALARAAEWAGDRRSFAVAATGGKLAARIRRILGLPAAEARGHRWPAALLVMSAALLIACFAPIHQEDHAMASQAEAGAYDHFFYLRHNEKNGTAVTDSLMMVKITPNAFEQRDLYSQSNLHVGWEQVRAVGGKFYAFHIGDLLSIDLATGKAEKIDSYVGEHVLAGDKLYAIVRDELRVYDLTRRVYRDLGANQVLKLAKSVGGTPPMAVSPDGKRLAQFQHVERKEKQLLFETGFQLRVFDVTTGKAESIGPDLHAITFTTGGGWVDEGPPFAWLDAKTIILVSEGPGRSAMVHPKPVEFGPNAPTMLRALDLATGKLTDIVALPRWSRSLGEPYFIGADGKGVPRIVLGELGQYRIDLDAKKIVEDDELKGGYRFRRGRPPERVSFGKTTLDEGPQIDDVSVSPSGASAVWLARRHNKGEILFYSAAEGKVRPVASGWIPRSWSWRRPANGSMTWARAEDIAGAAVPAAVPDGWKAFKPVPYPEPPPPREADLRPVAAQMVDYAIASDKAVYKQHESVQLTVSMTNKTERDISFARPTNYGNFFGVRMDYPRGSTLVSEFDRLDQIFTTDPVVIKPGQSFRVTKTIESEGAGKHKVEAHLNLGMLGWQGPAAAKPLEFNVVASDDGPELFKAKYARQMALCRAEFNNDPATCYHWRVRAMGPGAAPLLIADLTAEPNVRFRQVMGQALVGIASPDALPYFEKLLQGDLKDDRDMVLSGLAEMIRYDTAKDRALPLLISATKHATIEVRRGAVARLTKFRNPKIKEAMEAVLSDEDKDVAIPAARYLAAMENLDLIGWLTAAVDQPTQARYVAAKSIVAELERTWNDKKGKLPDVPWAKADATALDLYRQTLRSWLAWARENPRESTHFFDEDRKASVSATTATNAGTTTATIVTSAGDLRSTTAATGGATPAGNLGTTTTTTTTTGSTAGQRISRPGPADSPRGSPRQLPAELTGPDSKLDVETRELLLHSLPPVSPLEKLFQDEPTGDRQKVLKALAEKISLDDADAVWALPLLISATKHDIVEVRRGAVANLVKFRGPKVKEAMYAALSDADAVVATSAARYVAANENLDLIDWLAAAMSQPTRSRYFAAKVIVADLERATNEMKGKLPDVDWPKPGQGPVEVRNSPTIAIQDGPYGFNMRTELNPPEVGWPNADAAALALYRQTLRNWLAWALQHPRESSHYFDEDRKAWKNR